MDVEIYKIYVQTAENNSDRRQRYNALFFVIISAIVGFLAQFLSSDEGHKLPILASSILGIVICWAWYGHIESHKAINRRKFDVIHDLERSFEQKPFQREWKGRSHATLSTIEKRIPVVFAVGFAFLIIIQIWETFSK